VRERRGRSWAAGEERASPRERKEVGRAGLEAGLYFLPFSFSNPFETQIYLNSNELLNSNPVHSFQ
jgi:hypothetical protein